MFRKIVMSFPVLAFAIPLLAASTAGAWDPLQIGKHDQVWPDQWEPGKFDQFDQFKPIEPDDPCAPVWEETLCINPPCPDALVNPCTGETVAEEPVPLPDDLDI